MPRLTEVLSRENLTIRSSETFESTLEDVFTLLAHRGETACWINE
jgi:hypothetical protein